MPAISTKSYTAAKITLIEEAFAAQLGYRTTLDNGSPNPQTKAQFVSEEIDKYIFSIVQNNHRQRKFKEFQQTLEAEPNLL